MSPPLQLRQLTSNCSSLLIYRPQKDERLSWPSWLTYSGWFTHISGHPSATGQAQDSESTPAKDRCSTAGPHNQPLQCTLHWAALFSKIAPSHGECKLPSNTWFLGPTRVLNPNGISIGSAVFAGLTSMTDRQTDRQTDGLTDRQTTLLGR